MARVEEKYVTDGTGRKTAVIIPIGRYRRMLEDLHDLRIVAERRDEPTMSFRELEKRLRRDGLL